MKKFLRYSAFSLMLLFSIQALAISYHFAVDKVNIELMDLADSEGEEDLNEKYGDDDVKQIPSNQFKLHDEIFNGTGLDYAYSVTGNIQYLDFPTPPPES